MDKKTLGALAVLSFAIILFMPLDSDYWKFFIVLGIILGISWGIKD